MAVATITLQYSSIFAFSLRALHRRHHADEFDDLFGRRLRSFAEVDAAREGACKRDETDSAELPFNLTS
jgi:hypothetical protein